MKNLRYDNEQGQSVAYEKALPELLRNKCGEMPDRCSQCGAAINCKDIEEAEK